MKLESVFAHIHYRDIFIGTGVSILVFSFLFLVDWHQEETFHGSAPEIQKLEQRLEILEKKIESKKH